MDTIQSFNLDDLGDFDFPPQVLTKVEEIQEKNPVTVTTIISEGKKKTVKSEFVIAFIDNLETLLALDLTTRDIRVITHILKVMEFGNLICLNQAKIAEDLNIKASNMSAIFKKLKQKGVLVENDGHLYMNSNIFSKGLPHKLGKEKNDHLRSAKLETEHFTKSF